MIKRRKPLNNFARLAAAMLLLIPAVGLANSISDSESLSKNSKGVIQFIVGKNKSGRISYAPGKIKGSAKSALTGSGIQFGNVKGSSTPQHNFTSLDIIGGLLNFKTGNFIKGDSTHWFFDGGARSSVSLTAQCVDLDRDHDKTCDSNDLGAPINKKGKQPRIMLMSGIFDGAQVRENPITKTFTLFASIDYKENSALLAYFGLGNPAHGALWEGTLNFNFDPGKFPKHSAVASTAFTSKNINAGQVTNASTPEPAGLTLLGIGLLGVAALVRRKLLSVQWTFLPSQLNGSK